ncbi:D-Ala-D-Ala carboxypeptidase VanY [Bacillus cereus]|uniref:D-Ala-D-Ala carboxypeptidase VanY n=1 Tax=Bacillus cereus TaxID=1396 RepID=A0A2B0TE09_BACCE|nr:M15 family metallopeptidase [Bacillus cereus]PFL15198.1 D-Ala-D-Ala carboxypeptidase VanY [Bacillus cereus]PFU41180.1 D-Ala-D-Ala carboxypeptidase VanY [Bacillus cereus]
MVLAMGCSLAACSGEQTSKATTNNKNEKNVNKKDVLPISDPNDWRIILVNREHMLSKEIGIELTSITQNAKPNMKIDSRIATSYQDMVAAAKKDGINLYLRSGYRAIKLQQTYYDASVKSYKSQGLSDEEASAKALEYLQYPGASEHHTGLALDIISVEWQNTVEDLNATFENTDAFKWLDKNAAEYGFIIRYPKDKENITGIKYEPWHYRYVGKEVAAYLKEKGLTLEEYSEKIKSDK